jgi:hypothetical protein
VLKFYILQALFQVAQHLYEKRERTGSGSITLTKGSGSCRSKNLQICIRNTGETRRGEKNSAELTNLDVLAVQEDFSRDLRAAEKSKLAPPVLKI